mmetsp:Transcript_65253/g.199617  ORF Transcript_65253/g.199617 Transcript_65253/m.199617 type:complete len:210 (+) Transcript_65253:1674-2303(+)
MRPVVAGRTIRWGAGEDHRPQAGAGHVFRCLYLWSDRPLDLPGAFGQPDVRPGRHGVARDPYGSPRLWPRVPGDAGRRRCGRRRRLASCPRRRERRRGGRQRRRAQRRRVRQRGRRGRRVRPQRTPEAEALRPAGPPQPRAARRPRLSPAGAPEQCLAGAQSLAGPGQPCVHGARPRRRARAGAEVTAADSHRAPRDPRGLPADSADGV